MTSSLDLAFAELSRRVEPTSSGGVVLDDEVLHDAQVPGLLGRLVHARFFQGVAAPPPHNARASGDSGFVAHLNALTRNASGWETGFRLVRAADGWSFASNGKLVLFLDEPGQLSPPKAREGEAVLVRVPRARENLHPNRFTLFGGQGGCGVTGPWVKHFLTVTLEGAQALVAFMSSRAGDTLRFSLMIGNEPRLLPRSDAAVIDVAAKDAEPVNKALRDFFGAHPQALAPIEPPLFVKQAGLGHSVVETRDGPDIADGFGWARSVEISEAVIAGCKARERKPEQWKARFLARSKYRG